jgi:hypothetical protein
LRTAASNWRTTAGISDVDVIFTAVSLDIPSTVPPNCSIDNLPYQLCSGWAGWRCRRSAAFRCRQAGAECERARAILPDTYPTRRLTNGESDRALIVPHLGVCVIMCIINANPYRGRAPLGRISRCDPTLP